MADASVMKFARKYQTLLEEDRMPHEIVGYITALIGLRVVSLHESYFVRICNSIADAFECVEITDKVLTRRLNA
jgi:hypothetical protein